MVASSPSLSGAYHLRVAADGSWRLRVYDLPPAGCPWLTELAASPLGPRAIRRPGAGGLLTVLTVADCCATTLPPLLARLAHYGLRPAPPLGARPRVRPA